ncbi:hypothetical protein Trihar35433_6668 [Trichoderma harzianum]|nr:hypothetical protein Trihar35433_6668 [Trichoderma harzianum]
MSAPTKSLRIAIVGGGLGGLMTALCVHSFCDPTTIKIDVYEQASEYKEIGAGVSLGRNTLRVIKQIGLYEQTYAIAGKTNIWLSARRYDTGEEIARIRADGDEPSHLPVHRAEFLALLVRTIKERAAATLHPSKKCLTIEEMDDAIVLNFADGTTATAGLVVAADGIHSRIRQHYHNDDAQFGGMVVYRGLAPTDAIKDWWPLDTYTPIWIGPGRYFIVYPVSDGSLLNIGAFVATDGKSLKNKTESWTLRGDRLDLEKDYADFDPTVSRLIQHLDEKPLKWILYDRPLCNEWVFANGKVALLGDAAHAMVPHQGAGVGQAIEDGYILGQCLRDYLNDSGPRTLEDWLTNVYQSVRLPRAQRVQTTSRENGNNLHAPSNTFKDPMSEECLKQNLQGRMKWIWDDDLDAMYNNARKNMLSSGADNASCKDSQV